MSVTDGRTDWTAVSGVSTRHKIGHVGNQRSLFCVKQALFSWRPCVRVCVSVCLSQRRAVTSQKLGVSIILPLFPFPTLSSSLPPFFFFPGSFLLPSLSISLYQSFSLLPSSLSLPPFLFSGFPPLERAEGSAEGSTKGSAERYELPSGFGQSPAAINGFGTFWGEKNKPLVSGDNDVEEVYRRRTSFASRKVDENFGVPNTPDLKFWECPDTHDTRSMAAPPVCPHKNLKTE